MSRAPKPSERRSARWIERLCALADRRDVVAPRAEEFLEPAGPLRAGEMPRSRPTRRASPVSVRSPVWTSCIALWALACSGANGAGPQPGTATAGPATTGGASGVAGSASAVSGQAAPAQGGVGGAARAGSGGASGSAGPSGGAGAGTMAAAGGGSGGNVAGSAAGAAGVAASAGAGAEPQLPATLALYVSGYGPDVTVLELDSSTGMATKRASLPAGISPSYMAFTPDRRFAYAINEAGGSDSKVVAFAIDPVTGALRELNTAVTGGSGAPHLAVHPGGKWLAVAHYGSGDIALLPIEPDGRVGAAGPLEKGPNGGCQNAHQAVFDRSGKHLFVPCLGSNYVLQLRFDAGKLSYNDPATVPVPGGPRHMAFDPQERRAFVLAEHASTLTTFDYDAAQGRLQNPRSVPSYERNAGSSAHVAVHPSGEWLYASNRSENSIGVFSIDAAGGLEPVAFVTDMIATPRDFSIDPSGRFLIAANQAGPENVLVFRIAPEDGRLTRSSSVAVGGQPTFTQAIVLPGR